MAVKPKKPYKTFPLFPHPNGQWAKKILGKLHYFGKWNDVDAALAKYRKEHAHLFAGEEPPVVHGTLGTALATFLGTKANAVAGFSPTVLR